MMFTLTDLDDPRTDPQDAPERSSLLHEWVWWEPALIALAALLASLVAGLLLGGR